MRYAWDGMRIVAAFGLLGYVLVKFGCEPAPLLLGFVLGPMLEEHLRRAMIIARGDPLVFLQRPISAVLLGLAATLMVALRIIFTPGGDFDDLIDVGLEFGIFIALLGAVGIALGGMMSRDGT